MIFRSLNKALENNGLPKGLPTTLISKRLLLKPYTLADWPKWTEKRILSRENVQQWEPFWAEDILTLHSFEKRVRFNTQSWENGTGYFFLIWDKQNNDLIGGVSLSRVLRGVESRATLGYWCAVDCQRQGFTYEALLKVIEFAFQDLKLHRLEATCMPANVPSLNLLDKLGFKQEGLLKGYLNIQGQWEDHFMLALLNEAKPD